MKQKDSKNSQESGVKSGSKGRKMPTTLFQLLVYVIKNIIKTLPKRIILSLITALVVWGIHTYLMVFVNDGFRMDNNNKALNSVLAFGRDAIKQDFFTQLRYFAVAFFWVLVSMLFWGCFAQIRAFGLKVFILRIFNGTANLVVDITEKPGTMPMRLFISFIFVGFLSGLIIGNPLVCLLLGILTFLSVCSRGNSFLLLVIYLFWSDLQRLFRFKNKKPFYIDLVSMSLRGLVLGLVVFSISAFVPNSHIIQYIVLAAFFALVLINFIKRAPAVASVVLIILLFSAAFYKVAYADDGGWKESGGSFWNWISGESAWEAFKKGLEPVLWVISLGIGFVPVLGDFKDAQEAILGIDLVTGEKLSATDRLITAAAMFIPVVNGKLLRGGGEVAEALFKNSDEIIEFGGKHGDEVFEQFGKYGDNTLEQAGRHGDDAADARKGTNGSSSSGHDTQVGSDGLNHERRDYYRQKIDEAEALGDTRAADDARYERYRESKNNLGKNSMEREEWQNMNDRLAENRSAGIEMEAKGRDSLSDHLGRDLENNNQGNVVTHKTDDGVVTRPDSIGRNEAGDVDLVHDHKHFTGEGDQVVYNDSQMRAERDMLEAGDGRHVVTVSSDHPNLSGNPPNPRPSGPLADQSDVFYTDPQSGNITHQWDNMQERWVPID